MNRGPFRAADLPMSPDGTVYHLNVSREQIAPKILLVGDPDRVPLIAEQALESVEHDEFHRGLRTITGYVRGNGARISIVTSGMGTPSVEIVLNELMALNEIDPKTRCRRDTFERLDIIRVGTCGLLQSDVPLGTPVISLYAVGLDNTGLFYESDAPDECATMIERGVRQMLSQAVAPSSRFYSAVSPYVSKADSGLVKALRQSAASEGISAVEGVTASSCGFFATQGRDVGRMRLTVPEIDTHLGNLELGESGLRIVNMEMEASYLFHFAQGHGYRAAAICAGVANRRSDTFAEQSKQHVQSAVQIAVKALTAATNP